MKETEIPDWFGKALGIVRHQDKINSWPRWQQLAHRWFIAWRCPACKAAKENKNGK